MARFPAWFQISEQFPPRLYHTAEEVPPGWVRLDKYYDPQTGQWIKGDGKGGSGEPGEKPEKVDALDLPSIAGFVRDGFDRDDPEHGNPPRPLAVAEPADEIEPAGKPEADSRAAKKRPKRAKKAAGAKADKQASRNRAKSRRV